MQCKFTKAKHGIIGFVGHVGVGHAHSLGGIIQDDSAGFAVVGSIIRDAIELDTTIKSVQCDLDSNCIQVTTTSGGVGRAHARRGITPSEAELVQRAVGKDGLLCQSATITALGRIYGQGACETACALESAIALAVFDCLSKNTHVLSANCNLPGRYDRILCCVVDICDVPVSLMLVVNATYDGIGPDEDYEGNTMLGIKYEAMKKVGLDTLPTIIIESKFYRRGWSDGISQPHMVVRSEKGIDNIALANTICHALKKLGFKYLYKEDAMPIVINGLQKATDQVADNIIELATHLKEAQTAYEKVKIIAELNRLTSEDAGGVTFMSNHINERVRGAGLEPNTGAVLSMLVPQKELLYWKIPIMTAEDIDHYRATLVKTLSILIEQESITG